MLIEVKKVSVELLAVGTNIVLCRKISRGSVP